MKRFLSKHSSLNLLLAIVFFALSFYFYSIGEFALFRAMRGIVCFFALGLLFYYRRQKISLFIALFLICYGASSVTTIWYENALIATWSMALNFIAFVFLIFALWPKVSLRSMSKSLLVLFVVLILFNGYLLIEFVQMIRDFTLSKAHYIFMLLGAMSVVVTGFMSLLYNHRYGSRSSLLFVFFVFAIIFAEVFRGIAYYDLTFGNSAPHIARAILILGVFLVVAFERAEKKDHEKLRQFFFKFPCSSS